MFPAAGGLVPCIWLEFRRRKPFLDVSSAHPVGAVPATGISKPAWYDSMTRASGDMTRPIEPRETAVVGSKPIATNPAV